MTPVGQHRVGIKLMYPFVEKLLTFKKVCSSGPKGVQKRIESKISAAVSTEND